MLLCTDVHYRENTAQAAGLLFTDWSAAAAQKSYTTIISPIAAYEPGAFYKRELPCLLQLIELVEAPIDLIIIDGHVWLDADRKPGLGAYLYEALDQQIPIIGVAKNAFKSLPTNVPNGVVQAVLRGRSQKPLYLTAVGMELRAAVKGVQAMHGAYRTPALLKEVDQLGRG
jgi:deoxyribonuclease V